MMTKFHRILCALCVIGSFVACVDNDDDIPENYYVSTKMTAAQFLQENEARLGDFITLLKRTPYFSLLSTYGNFTVFAPTNEAVEAYLEETGYNTIENIPTEVCDTLVRTHIVKEGAYYTTDIGEGTLPDPNMAKSDISLTLDYDSTNNNSIRYYANKTARMIEYDDSVTNGVVHIVSSIIRRSSDMLPDVIESDSTLSLFSQALRLTGMADSLMKNIDETYVWGSDKKTQDSLYNGILVRCQSGSVTHVLSRWPETRYFKYTAFVEPDSVYHRHNIYTIDDLIAYAKKVYDETYPEDAGKYDDNPRHRKNPLNRFVSYHLVNRILRYDDVIMTKQLISKTWDLKLSDPEEFYETMCPGTLMRFAFPNEELYINRKGVLNRASIRGVKVLAPSITESGKTNQDAVNGTYHYLDDILAYTTQVREEVFNCRIRVDANTLSPDFANCGARGRYGHDDLVGLRNNYITDWTVRGTNAYVGLHSDVGYWNSYKANAVCISGIFDVTFKLPPVPSGTYEIRLGYTVGEERGVVQFYLNNEPCGIPVDLRTYGGDPTIGWVEDTDDKEENTANDKAMRNHGYMKGLGAYHNEGGENPLRANNWNLRRILTTQYLDENTTYNLRCRQVLEDDQCYWSFDFIELCPKSIYGSPQGEDIY